MRIRGEHGANCGIRPAADGCPFDNPLSGISGVIPVQGNRGIDGRRGQLRIVKLNAADIKGSVPCLDSLSSVVF